MGVLRPAFRIPGFHKILYDVLCFPTRLERVSGQQVAACVSLWRWRPYRCPMRILATDFQISRRPILRILGLHEFLRQCFGIPGFRRIVYDV